MLPFLYIADLRTFEVWLTCEVFLSYFEGVHDGGEDALDSAKHAAQPQIDQH